MEAKRVLDWIAPSSYPFPVLLVFVLCLAMYFVPHKSHFQGHLQFSSVSLVTQSCLTLCDPMNRSTPRLPVHHQLPEFTQTHVHPAISSSVIPFFSCLQSFSVSRSFQMSQILASGGQALKHQFFSVQPALWSNSQIHT